MPFKYIPLKMEHIDYNFKLKALLTELSKSNKVENLILYGLKGSSKYIFMKCYLNLVYKNNNLIYKSIIEKKKLSNKYEITYCRTNYTYEFFNTENIINNYLIIKEIIYEICKNNTIDNSLKIFIINDIDSFNSYNNKIIPLLLRKFNNIRIVGLCNKSIILSDFLLLRCRCLNNFELYKITHFINLSENLKIDYEEELEIVKSCNNNLNLLFELLNKKKFNIKHIDHFEIIVDLILRKDLQEYNNIKNILQNIFILNEYSIDEILEKIVKIFIKKTNLEDNIKLNLYIEIGNINIKTTNKFNILDCLIFLLYKLIL